MCLLPEQMQAIEDNTEAEYYRGHDEGFDEGYAVGFDDGKFAEELANREQSVIYKTAYERGFKAGRQEHLDRDTLRSGYTGQVLTNGYQEWGTHDSN